MNIRFKVFASYNIFQYMYDFNHILIFVTVSKCRKSPNLTNIVIRIPTSGGFILESTPKPMNTIHQLSDVTLMLIMVQPNYVNM